MVVTAFYFIAYVFPLVGNLLFHDDIVPTVQVFPLTSMVLFVLAATYLLFLVFASSRAPILPRMHLRRLASLVRRGYAVYRRRRTLVALGILGLSVAFIASGLSDYRYSSQGISQTGSPVLLLLIFLTGVLRVVVLADLFYNMFVSRRRLPRFLSRVWRENVLLSSALLLMADGTGSAFLALIAFAYAVHPSGFRFIVFQTGRPGRLQIARVVAVLAIGVLFMVAWFLGESLKASTGTNGSLGGGIETTWGVITAPGFATDFFLYFVGRLSTYYYSLLFTVGHSWMQINSPDWALLYPLKSLLFRPDFLLGSPFDIGRPDVGSISALNYRNLHLGVLNPREGSSPGLVSSFVYVFPFPFNVFFCALYMAWLSRMFDRLIIGAGNARLSVLGSMLVLMFVIIFFQSPFDFLRVIDDGVIQVAVFLLMYNAVASSPSPARDGVGDPWRRLRTQPQGASE